MAKQIRTEVTEATQLGSHQMFTTYTIRKRLEGNLKGIYVTDTLTQDATLPAPFHGGQYVKGLGCPYTVISVEVSS